MTASPQINYFQTQQIVDIICPSSPLSQDIYFAALSSLAKAILLQAETEVTAEKRSAIPLAMVAARLLGTLHGFPDIFFAKLVQRSGGWPVPTAIPSTDSDGTAWDEEQRTKAMGYRVNDNQRESLSDHVMRVSGMMRVYFLILAAPVPQPLEKMFQLPRFWTYFARMMGDERLLETVVAAEVLHGTHISRFGAGQGGELTRKNSQLHLTLEAWKLSSFGVISG